MEISDEVTQAMAEAERLERNYNTLIIKLLFSLRKPIKLDTLRRICAIARQQAYFALKGVFFVLCITLLFSFQRHSRWLFPQRKNQYSEANQKTGFLYPIQLLFDLSSKDITLWRGIIFFRSVPVPSQFKIILDDRR